MVTNDINKIDSKIITSKEELDFITNRLKQIDYFKNKNLSFELVFRGTRDGRTPKIFHQKCDGTPKTITIIKTVKGLKFGGYIEKEWKNNGGWISNDENCFIFSIDLNKIYILGVLSYNCSMILFYVKFGGGHYYGKK